MAQEFTEPAPADPSLLEQVVGSGMAPALAVFGAALPGGLVPTGVACALFAGARAVSMESTSGLCGLLLTYPCLVLGKWIWTNLLRQPTKPSKFGKWACVTGATDGIGKAYALELAKKHNMNILLISRTQSKLDAVAKEITDATDVKVDTIAVDFSDFNKEKQAEVAAKAKEYEIGVLVNNVGMSYPSAMYYHDTTIEMQQKLIAINVDSVMAMTHLLLPGMMDRKKGFVVNVSSAASLAPQELYVGYGAVKSYVNNFTYNMNLEYNRKGIYFQVQTPLYVVSKLAKIRKPSFTTPTPKGYVKSAMGHFGWPGQVSPFLVHALIMAVTSALPAWLYETLLSKMHHGIRRKYIKKLERKAREAKQQ